MGCLKKYETVQDILKEFFDLRLSYYGLRKEWLVGMLGAESTKLNNQARFILEKIQGKITIGKMQPLKIWTLVKMEKKKNFINRRHFYQ